MKTVNLTLTGMGNGGVAFGRDSKDHIVFVPFAIPGERVQVIIEEERGKKHFQRGRVQAIIEPSPYRVEAPCPHFGICGGCHFQHIKYGQQLVYKQTVVAEQLQRIGGLAHPTVRPTLANPDPWAYSSELNLNFTPDGQLGLWSPVQQQIFAITTCPITQPNLVALHEDFELDFPDLQGITLRQGYDGELMAILDVGNAEGPELAVDFPVSVAVRLPEGRTATLIGDLYLVQTVKGQAFRVSPSCYFPPSLAAAALLIDTILHYTQFRGTEQVLELYSGVGLLTRWLAEKCATLVGVEANPDAIADAAANLDETDNVTLYEGTVEEILPGLELQPDWLVLNPPGSGISKEVLDWVRKHQPVHILYISSDVATLARDGKGLVEIGYTLGEVQPIDMRPQTYHVETVSLWQKI